MNLVSTEIEEIARGKYLVTMHFSDAEGLEEAREDISLTVQIDLGREPNPFLSQVQGAALERARDELEREIRLKKSAESRFP